MNILPLENREVFTFIEADEKGMPFIISDKENFWGTEYCVIQNQDSYDFWLYDEVTTPCPCLFIDKKQGAYSCDELKTFILTELYSNYEKYWDDSIVNYYKETYGNTIMLDLHENTLLKACIIDDKYIVEWWMMPNGDIESNEGRFFIYTKDDLFNRIIVHVGDLCEDLCEDDNKSNEMFYDLLLDTEYFERFKSDTEFYNLFEKLCNLLINIYLNYYETNNDNV